MNAETTLRAIELAHEILQNNLADEFGQLTYDDSFFKGLDILLKKLHETREFAEAMR